jgi:hypothetical protein
MSALAHYDYIAASDDVHVHESFGGAGICRDEWLCYPCEWRGKMLLLGRHAWNIHRPNTFESLLSSPQYSKIKSFDRKLAREASALLRDCLPIRIRGLHLCLPFRRPPFNLLLPVIKFICGKSIRQRAVIHHGSHLEILLGLENHGIARANIPPALGGDYNLHAQLTEWLAHRLELEGRREANA